MGSHPTTPRSCECSALWTDSLLEDERAGLASAHVGLIHRPRFLAKPEPTGHDRVLSLRSKWTSGLTHDPGWPESPILQETPASPELCFALSIVSQLRQGKQLDGSGFPFQTLLQFLPKAESIESITFHAHGPLRVSHCSCPQLSKLEARLAPRMT